MTEVERDRLLVDRRLRWLYLRDPNVRMAFDLGMREGWSAERVLVEAVIFLAESLEESRRG